MIVRPPTTSVPTLAQVRFAVDSAKGAKSPRSRDLHAAVARERIRLLRAETDAEEADLDALEHVEVHP